MDRWQKELFSARVYQGTRRAGLYRLDQIQEAMEDGSIWLVPNIGQRSVVEIAKTLRMEVPALPTKYVGIVPEIKNGVRPRYKTKWWER